MCETVIIFTQYVQYHPTSVEKVSLYALKSLGRYTSNINTEHLWTV